jgi:AraC-like DNA-binding protein
MSDLYNLIFHPWHTFLWNYDMISDLIYNRQYPPEELNPFIAFYWALENPTDVDEDVTILPDGYFDIIYVSDKGKPFRPLLFGLATKQAHVVVKSRSLALAISFKLPAAETVLDHGIAGFTDHFDVLEDSHWPGFLSFDLEFSTFCDHVNEKLSQWARPHNMDIIRILFEFIYKSAGNKTVSELSLQSGWSTRKLNRYFQHYFGIPLKTYCNILRFRSSFNHLHLGELHPSAEFTDQSHFIREIRKYAGTTPGVLARNPGDRFIQFSTLPLS